MRALLEHAHDAVISIDEHGRVSQWNRAAERLFGWSPIETIGQPVADLIVPPALRGEVAGLVARYATAERLEDAHQRVTLQAIDRSGRQLSVEVSLTATRVAGRWELTAFGHDVSERREFEARLRAMALSDGLTGLANRRGFMEALEKAVSRHARGGPELALLFLDLDGFKEVNDSLGHATGDALLVTVATRLTDCLRPGDTIARLGGDEFAILVEGAQTGTEFTNAAERIREALEPAVVVDGRSLFIRASVGIATAEIGMVDADQLIRNADLAMYQAKERRDGEFALYDPSMHSTLVERLALEAELRTAVSEGLMKVHYQPTYTLDQGALVGVEALLRWTHPERGEIAPDVFIPLAEQTGLIHELGRFVLREACLQGQRWRELAPDTVLTIGVNVSTRQLQRATFAEEVREALAESGFPAKHLILEMTESVLMNDTDSSLATLKELKAMGLRIAIDDFGTGYSSLSYLHRFPVDILKIDRSFIERLSDSDARDSLVQSIVQLGHTLQLETVAEGIEDNTQLQALRRLGCEMAQGFHFGRPGPPDEVANLLMLASSSADVSDNPAATSVNPADAGKIPGQRPAAELSVRSGGDGE
jgi:diguanylate cyclase (GGDEF)-like protein/PAS domain S-box-containing protein